MLYSLQIILPADPVPHADIGTRFLAALEAVLPGQRPLALHEPLFGGNEWAYVKECIDTGWVSSVGKYVDEFERRLAEITGSRYAIATFNGTAALHIALKLAGVQPDDEVLVPALSFVATANAVAHCGASPHFVDCDEKTLGLDAGALRDYLRAIVDRSSGFSRNRTTGRKLAAIVPMHTFGHPSDIDGLIGVAADFGIPLVEDAAESLGSYYHGRHTGTFGMFGTLSFNGNKIITTGGGGMITTASAAFAAKAKYLTTQAKDDPLEYEHHEVGYNYRLTNLQAAMGCAQLEQLDAYIARKRDTARFYAGALAEVRGISCMQQAPWAESIAWMFTIRVDAAAFGMDSRALLRWLDAEKIQTRPLWQPMHRSLAHAGSEVVGGEVADALCRDCLSLPCSADISDAQRERVVAAIRAAAS